MNECIDEHICLAAVQAAQGFVPAGRINCNLSVVLHGFVLENLPWLGLALFIQSGRAQKGFGWQLKLGHFPAVHTAGGPIPSNLPSSSPSKCPAALSAGGFGCPLGKPHRLLTFLLSEIKVSSCILLAQRSRWVASGPAPLVITKVHGCLCWRSSCSGEIPRAHFELMLQVSEVKNPHQIRKKWNKNQYKK